MGFFSLAYDIIFQIGDHQPQFVLHHHSRLLIFVHMDLVPRLKSVRHSSCHSVGASLTYCVNSWQLVLFNMEFEQKQTRANQNRIDRVDRDIGVSGDCFAGELAWKGSHLDSGGWFEKRLEWASDKLIRPNKQICLDWTELIGLKPANRLP